MTSRAMMILEGEFPCVGPRYKWKVGKYPKWLGPTRFPYYLDLRVKKFGLFWWPKTGIALKEPSRDEILSGARYLANKYVFVDQSTVDESLMGTYRGEGGY